MVLSRRRVSVLVALLALSAAAYGGLAAPSPIYASDQDQGSGGSGGSVIGVNEEDETGQRIWYGEEPPEVTALADVAEEVAQEHPDTVLGVALTSDRQVVEVYVVSQDAEGVARLRESAESAGDPERLRVIVSTSSPARIQEAVNQVLAMDMDGLGIESVAPDPVNDGIQVGLTDEYTRPESAGGRSEEEKQAALDALEKVSVPVRVTYQPALEPAGTRENDTAPYCAGARVTRSPGEGEDEVRCSLGVPVELDGHHYVLTAGHCGTGRWENGSELVGTTLTTTWPANAERYGDWQLLQGSSYAMEVYDGDVSSSSSTRIIGAFFGARAQGRELCMSGATTGQTCRYVVAAFNDVRKVGDTIVGQTTTIVHDGDRDGNRDCNGFDGGDSGGIAHFTHGQGGQIAYGVITSYNTETDPCSYAVTQLSGLLDWNSDVRVG